MERPSLILFLHGSGDSGENFRATLHSLQDLDLLLPPRTTTLFPTAPSRPYTPMHGLQANVWFDRPKLSYDEVEDNQTMKESLSYLNGILDVEFESLGEPDPIVVLIGFSMGGSMALHLAFDRLRRKQPVHGVMVISSFIGEPSNVIPDPQKGHVTAESVRGIPIRMIHGSADSKVPSRWGSATASRLRNCGFQVDFTEIAGLQHDISLATINEITVFVSGTVAKCKVS